jgi:hypothetical protein
VVVPVSDPVLAPLKHGAWASDVPAAVEERLADPALPDYVRLPVFRPVAEIALRRVERAARFGQWLGELSPDEASTPRRAGSSSPEEIGRHLDDSAIRALGQLGLTPSAMAKFGRMLEERQRPDLALLHAALVEEGDSAG